MYESKLSLEVLKKLNHEITNLFEHDLTYFQMLLKIMCNFENK
jgi:hypothetical protein